MTLPNLNKIQHYAAITAVALSPDEKMIACGSWQSAPITVWEMATGNLVAELSGCKGEVHSLAFSPDSARVAAATVWGGIWVWQLGDGQMVQHKEQTKSRRIRSLTFPGTAQSSTLPVMLSDSIHRGQQRALAPNGKFLAAKQLATISVTQYRTKTEIGRLDPFRYAVVQAWVRYMRWSADSQLLALCGDGWVGIWSPFTGQFFARSQPAEFLYDIAVLGSSRQVVCAMGKLRLQVVDLRLEPLLTSWEERYQRFVGETAVSPTTTTRNDWNWNVTQWGYEGVHLEANGLLWYDHRHNTMDGGGGATEQSYASFLVEGTTFAIPEDVLGEVCRAVNLRLQQKNQ
jgi:hypothetical protein